MGTWKKKRFLPLLWCASLSGHGFSTVQSLQHTQLLYIQKPQYNWLLQFLAPMVWWPRGPHARSFPQHFLRVLFSGVRYLPVNTFPGISLGGFLAESEVWHSPVIASFSTSEADFQQVLLVWHHTDFSAIQQATTAHFPTRKISVLEASPWMLYLNPRGHGCSLYTLFLCCVGFLVNIWGIFN